MFEGKGGGGEERAVEEVAGVSHPGRSKNSDGRRDRRFEEGYGERTEKGRRASTKPLSP
jgi:hypothetical protein